MKLFYVSVPFKPLIVNENLRDTLYVIVRQIFPEARN